MGLVSVNGSEAHTRQTPV